jgi:hypothetical protein
LQRNASTENKKEKKEGARTRRTTGLKGRKRKGAI